MALEKGDTVPPATFKQMTKDGIKDVELSSLLAGKKVILFGLPGAYTPVCSTQHLPGYVEQADKLKADGVDAIACISVNDPFVMANWGEQHGTGDKVMMLCDADAAFTSSIGLALDLSAYGLGTRSQRYSMVVENGKVTTINVEKSIFDHGSSAASALLAPAHA